MLDGVSLDQLRTFLAAVDEGSFSAAGRHLRRAQSVVSQNLANLEAQLGILLFDRSARVPRLTEQGRALVDRARDIVRRVDTFTSQAKNLAGGLEPEVSMSVDVMFPTEVLTRAVVAFHRKFPKTPLRLFVEALGAVFEPVLDGRCRLGISGSVPDVPAQFTSERLLSVEMIFVASSEHPLARHRGPVPNRTLAKHVQLVLTDRSKLSNGREYGVIAKASWRLADLGAKIAFLRAGLGWGSVPLELVRADLAAGTLIPIAIEDLVPGRYQMPMSAVYRPDAPPGPAGQWLIAQLKDTTRAAVPKSGTKSPGSPVTKRRPHLT